MNRFSKSSRAGNLCFSLVLPVVIFLTLITLFLGGISEISKTTETESLNSLKAALQRSIIHCYAIEGRYPPNLEYLEDHYGITYNENKYFIDYQPVASNIMPDITVIPLEADK